MRVWVMLENLQPGHSVTVLKNNGSSSRAPAPLAPSSTFEASHLRFARASIEFGSILKFYQFGLPSLGTTDARADDLSDCFDFSQPQHKFARVRVRVPR